MGIKGWSRVGGGSNVRMMGGRSKASVGGGGWVKAVQLGAGEERLGETRKRTVVSQMASEDDDGDDDDGDGVNGDDN